MIFAISLFVASVLVFVALSMLPGDPAQAMLGTQATPRGAAPAASPARPRPPALGAVPRVGQRVRPRRLRRLGGLAAPVAPQIASKLEVTGPLRLFGLLLALVVAVPTGVVAALRHRRVSGTAISAASQIGIAIPEFWAGILLITLVSVKLGWLPAGVFPGWSESVGGSLEHLILPAIALALVQAAVLTRYVRSADARGAARGLHADRARRRADALRGAAPARAAQRRDPDRDACSACRSPACSSAPW